MKTFVAALEVLIPFLVGAILIVSFQNWFWAGLGVYVWGAAASRFAFHPWLANMRNGLRLAPSAVYRAGLVANIAAGILVAVAAISSLEPAFASIVVLAATGWVSMWTWALNLLWKK